MPNFDGGHYFLTVLAPIRTDVLVTERGFTCSPMSGAYQVLATLPTALQSQATERIGINSPFTRTRRTHFARFAIIPDVVFNGRDQVNAVQVAIAGPNPTEAQPVDKLSCPYLVFVADFDAKSGEEAELRSYLAELWRTMGDELRAIFKFCIGFDRVKDGTSFQEYILRCQVETTMPFNDYWVGAPPLVALSKWLLLGPAVVTGLIIVVALLFAIMDVGEWPWSSIVVLGFIGFGVSIGFAYWLVMTQAATPFPAASNSDLPSVLKALYLQQHFMRFAEDNQGANPQLLYKSFGQFLAAHRPNDVEGPTQPPGVIRS